MKKILEKLCKVNGVSGNEHEVRETIISLLPSNCNYVVDALGNLIVTKQGGKPSKNKIMLSAHMDEVGMIVTSIEDDGSLKFSRVGGIDPEVIIGRQVQLEKISGVVGSKPIHLQNPEEKKKPISIDDLFIDIGAKNVDEAKELVNLGDMIYFKSDFVCFGDSKIKAKAIDDRFGCAVLLELLNSDLEYDFTCAFVVQEEVGLRGAKVASYTIDPDIAIVFEATTAADIPMAPKDKKACELGKGPVIPFMDNATIYDKELYKLVFSTAKENNIPCQTKTVIAGGNDAGAISQSCGGVRTLSISIPCRYLHSACNVVDENDMYLVVDLAKKILPIVCDI